MQICVQILIGLNGDHHMTAVVGILWEDFNWFIAVIENAETTVQTIEESHWYTYRITNKTTV